MTITAYFKKTTALFLLLIICTACTAVSPERKEIVEWASQIASLEKRLNYEVDTTCVPIVSSYSSTNEDVERLTECENRLLYLYGEIFNLYVPEKARPVHILFVESLAKAYEMVRYFKLGIETNNLSYFDKSRLASQEATRLDYEAFLAFVDLMDDYSIPCSEIDFCAPW